MPADPSLDARVRARLADLAARDLLRTLRPPFGVDLTSNDYLKLSSHPRVKAAFAAGAVAEGVGSTGSRLLRGERTAFRDIENRFADLKGAERGLFFSSGYLANIAVLTTLAEAGDVIFSDSLNHASLIDAARLSKATRVVFPHNDIQALEQLVHTIPDAGHRFIVVESLFSMDGDQAPLAAYAVLCRRVGASLVVDEAHGVGVFGSRGSGLIEAAGVAGDVLVSINTGGKALGVGGACVTGPAWVIDYLVQRGRPFVFSTAAPPAMAYALQASLDIVRDEPERRARLHELSAYLRGRLLDAGFDVARGSSHIVPVRIGANDRAVAIAATLQTDGFDVRAIRPPTVPPGTSRLRLSVNVGLDERQLDRFVERLTVAVKEADLCSAVSS
jgi:8-amino-7-oxononanoate synthase